MKKSSINMRYGEIFIRIETLTAHNEFEQNSGREIEKKYLPLFPERLGHLRPESAAIEQLYLSHPSEPFSLRLREISKEGTVVYSAALKDRGHLTDNGLDRLEVETEISAEIYDYYKNREHVILRKLRTEAIKNIAVDWFEDGHVHIESEHPAAWSAFLEQNSNMAFADITGDHLTDNEWRAHLDYRRAHNGSEILTPEAELDPELLARTIAEHHLHHNHTIVTIAGRSGSGKSTIIDRIQNQLSSNNIASILLSTDDYHRGKVWLENYKGSTWTEWDAPIVYDIHALQADIKQLQNGQSITSRRFDFATEEPAYGEAIEPAPVILVEGIYAGEGSFNGLVDFRYELPTPFATCVGRRLLRDLQTRPQFAEPEKSLRYILEQAEPAYNAIGEM